MATKMYLKFQEPAVEGGSKDSDHVGEVEVMSWNHSFSQPTSPVRSTAGGGTVEQATHDEFSFTKYVDSATNDLIRQCWTGKHIGRVTFTAYRADGVADEPVKYLEIVMEGVVVSSFSIGGGPGDLPTENVGLNYATVQYSYTPGDSSSAESGRIQPVKHDLVHGAVSPGVDRGVSRSPSPDDADHRSRGMADSRER